MIDKKGRIFGKINVFDLAILLIIVMLIFGYLYRDRATHINPEGSTVIVEVVCPNIYPGVENNLSVGDTLIAAGGFTGVHIAEMETKSANWVTTDGDGVMVLTKNPFRRDIFLTLEGKSSQISPTEIGFAGQKVRAGLEEFYVKTQKAELKATVISIEIKD